MFKREKSAYMTIEATLIMPLIVGGVIFILYLGFYLYNACTVKQTAYIAALRGSRIKKGSSAEIEDYVVKQVDELLQNQMLAREDIHKEIRISMGRINVKITTEIKMPFAGFLSSKVNMWKIEGQAWANRVDTIEIIREARKINGS